MPTEKTFLVIRADGTEETHPHDPDTLQLRHVAALIGAGTLDSFSLRNGKRVWVDDLGHTRGLPLNAKATAMYHAICKPGTTHPICGEVAVVEET
jgi:hypothetical protein